jgi:hypothetical protein
MEYIRTYYTPEDVYNNDVKLGNDKMLSFYEQIKDLKYPFLIYKDNENKKWVLEKEVADKTFEDFRNYFKNSDLKISELEELYEFGKKYF